MKFSERQIEIMKAATILIGEKGIQNLTTKSLAERMNFSEPALYRHFKNKTEILSSVLKFYQEEMKHEILKITDGESNGLKQLEQIIQFQFSYFTQHPAIVMVIFAETSFQYEQSLSSVVKSILFTKKEQIEKIILKGRKDGSIRKDLDPGQLSTIFMGSMRFTVLQWRLNKYKTDLTKDGRSLWKTFSEMIRSMD